MNRIEGPPTYCSEEGNWGVTLDGDVRPLADFPDGDFITSEYNPVKTRRPKRFPKLIIDPRNNKLNDLAVSITSSKRAESGSKLVPVPKEFGGTPVNASEMARTRLENAKKAGEVACKLCKVRSTCIITPATLMGKLMETDNNTNFKKQLAKTDPDQVLCMELINKK